MRNCAPGNLEIPGSLVSLAPGMTLSQRPDRSNSTTAMITASVIAVTTRRVVQLMPRPIHHNSAQLMTMGTMILSCKAASASVANGVATSMAGAAVIKLAPPGSKYPPAEPGALGIGPLEAAVRVADATLYSLAT